MATIPELLIQVAIGAVPLGVAAFAYRSATDANRRTQETAVTAAERQAELERTKVDAEAFARARQIYEDALAQLEKQLDRVQAQADRLSAQLAQEQDASNTMRDQVRALQGQISTLERTVGTLRRQLISAGITPQAGEGR
ncbi:hypothetical protein ACFY05_32100 [Microtetraspora fusca]|uniref:DUF2746 domain-containing protein n=1 Tax=Microtetraspora fusca TaxID=1997 RepID=A0ABW6VDT7_MICFU